MSEDDHPWDQPPEWVPYGDLAKWLARHHGLKGSEPDFLRAMIYGLRSGQLSHAIRDRDFIMTTRVSDYFSPDFKDPFAFESNYAVVKDWMLALVDWEDGTVCGDGVDLR